VARADFCIATSLETASAVQARWPAKRVFVCEPGVSPVFRRRPLRRARQSLQLVTVANLYAAKGHEEAFTLLERWSALSWRWHVVGCAEVGDGVAGRLRSRARQAGLIERIVFHGALPQAQVAAILTDADLMVQPSRFESYGMALAEAAAVGVPAVAFRAGAAERIVRHGTTGLLAAPGDWNALGECMYTLLTDPHLRATFERNLAAEPVRDWAAAFADFQAACDAMLAPR
jgi:glycosyltransferase involved in cell wall biosynthesis